MKDQENHVGTTIAADAVPAEAERAEGRNAALPEPGDSTTLSENRAADPAADAAVARPHLPRSRPWSKRLLCAGAAAGLAFGGYLLAPTVKTMMETVSTDDAYVNGHVTYVAPRVAGQVSRVLVDDNDRVSKGDLLVQLDKEPYEDAVAVKKAAVETAEAEMVAAIAQTRGLVAQIQADRFQLERAIEDVHTQVANLRANIATLKSRQATLELARNNLSRGEQLLPSGGISKEELDLRRQTVKVNEAAVDQAREAVLASRVGLGLSAQPRAEGHLDEVPRDLDQNYSATRQALGQLYRSVSLLGYSAPSWTLTSTQALETFLKQDPEGDLDHIFAKLVAKAPVIKQAESKLQQARRDRVLAELNLRYCDIVSEIEGVVTSRTVNPGNNVSPGQGLMTVRSLTDIWVDANFKETQLADLRIGQRVRCEVDMYGGRREFDGRITGFTMGTGQTLALLPPQNATGNFVKIVQRLPVRIELTGYNPDKVPLFVGLSVTPYVYYKEPASGPHAGEVLKPLRPRPRARAVSCEAEPSKPAAPFPAAEAALDR
jgi:membrane fusion protein (multidrug efflux system)